VRYSETILEHAFMKAAKEKQLKSGISLGAAIERLAHEQPELHQSFVETQRETRPPKAGRVPTK